MIKKNKKIYILVIAVIAVIISLVVFKKQNSDNYIEYTVVKQDISDELLLAGTIDAERRVDLGFANSGRIKKINFNIGDMVKKGDVIAEIEQNRLAADLTQAQANYTLARVDTRTNVDGAKSDLTKQIQEQNAIVEGLYQQYLSGDLQAYSLDDNDRDIIPPVISGSYLGSKEGEYILDVYSSNANSGYSFRLSGLESGTYTAEVNRAGKLGESGLYIQFIDNNSYGNTEWSVPVPNKRSSTYLARKTAYQNSITTRERIISSASTNVDKTSGIDNQTQISRDEALRRQAQAQVNAVAAQLDDGKIRAPFDGYVVKHDMEIGEIISGFTPQVTLFANTTKKLELNIPEIYINKIAVGDLVEIELDAYSGEIFEGIVDFIDVIDTEVDGVPVYKSDIILLSSDERIRVGMNAKASIVADSILDVIAIPNHYIIQDNTDQKKVLIQKTVRPPQVEERIVTTGFYGNDGFVEIISGLNEGDIVLLNKK